jgi:hypothetical protein
VEPTYRNDTFREGWYPDALIPLGTPSPPGAAAGRSSTYRGVPFSLPADETHTFWIDVHVPDDAREGEYRGTLRLNGVAEGGDAPFGVEVPVEVRVWPFGLPRSMSLRSEFGDSASRIWGWLQAENERGRMDELPERGALYAACARLTTEHRLNSRAPPDLMPGRPGPEGEFVLTPEQMEGWKAFLETYHVNALPVPAPHRYFPNLQKDRDAIGAYLRGWDRMLESVGRPDLVCYTYLIDEPNDPEAYEFTREWGRAIRQAGSRVRVLVTEQTKPQDEAWGDLYGAVDVWVPLFSLFDPESAARRRELGEEVWTYTALCQGKPTPWWHTDYPLLHYRVPAWMAWLHHMRGLLYWGGMAHWRDVDDPWTDPATYRGKGARRIVFNGEGTLLYPGWPAGVDGPLPSMRLKALRDGIEDFEYLAMLDSLGRRSVAEAMVRSVITGWYEWSGDAERYVHTRRKLGCLVRDALKAQRTSGETPPDPGTKR